MTPEQSRQAWKWFEREVMSEINTTRLFGDGARSDVVEARKHAQTIRQALTPVPDEKADEAEKEILERAIDRMGWDEINAFHAELRRGQGIQEDAGGYFLRCIKTLFGLKPQDEVTTYQSAAKAMITAALKEQQNV